MTLPAAVSCQRPADLEAVGYAAEASLAGARVPGFLFDLVRKHPGQELRDRRATPSSVGAAIALVTLRKPTTGQAERA